LGTPPMLRRAAAVPAGGPHGAAGRTRAMAAVIGAVAAGLLRRGHDAVAAVGREPTIGPAPAVGVLIGVPVVALFAGVEHPVAALEHAVRTAGAAGAAVGGTVVALLDPGRRAVAAVRRQGAVGVAPAVGAVVHAVVTGFAERPVDVAVAAVRRVLALRTAAPIGAAVDHERGPGIADLS